MKAKGRHHTSVFVKTRGIGETLGTARTTGQFGGKSTESSAIPLASSEALSALKSVITGYLQQRRWAYGIFLLDNQNMAIFLKHLSIRPLSPFCYRMHTVSGVKGWSLLPVCSHLASVSFLLGFHHKA